jgi:t-SNARE complex subunit (syntaxin)
VGQDREDRQGHRRVAHPDAGFAEEIRAAVRYERVRLWKACVALAAVALVVVAHVVLA